MLKLKGQVVLEKKFVLFILKKIFNFYCKSCLKMLTKTFFKLQRMSTKNVYN